MLVPLSPKCIPAKMFPINSMPNITFIARPSLLRGGTACHTRAILQNITTNNNGVNS